ncbi:MAG: hypothetical protein AAFR38_11920 [Planctomycetota bacterium]
MLALSSQAATSPQAYIDFRLAAGARWATREEMTDKGFDLIRLLEVYGADDEFAHSASTEDMFRYLWDCSREMNDGYAIHAKMPTEDLLDIRFGTQSRTSQSTAVAQGAGLDFETWHGSASASCRNWFMNPISFLDVRERTGVVERAVVGAVLEYPGGDHRSVMLNYYFSPSMGQWYFLGANINNFEVADRMTPCGEY